MLLSSSTVCWGQNIKDQVLLFNVHALIYIYMGDDASLSESAKAAPAAPSCWLEWGTPPMPLQSKKQSLNKGGVKPKE